VREIRTLRLTRRELETWLWWNCEPTPQAKAWDWKPSTYGRRASSRPYRRELRPVLSKLGVNQGDERQRQTRPLIT
jgi:hypothetical protein